MIEVIHKLALTYYLIVLLMYLSMLFYRIVMDDEVSMKVVSVFGYMLAVVPFLILLQGILIIWWL